MPYIDKQKRKELKVRHPQDAGELNYWITKQLLTYIKVRGESYQTYCEIEGVLSHASKELYRRHTALYENKKMLANGDV